jgi:competence protein ComEA
MSRRTTGALASTQPRTGDVRASGGASAGETRAARRLAASLGPPVTPGFPGGEEPGRQPGGGSTGLLDSGAADGFAYGGQAGSAGTATSVEVVEPRVRWRLGVRAAALVGVLSLLAGVLLWWQVAANGPVVIPLSSVTHDAAGTAANGPSGRESGGADSGGTDSGPGEEGTNVDGQDADERNRNGTPAGNVVVHVAGAVKKAGVVRLPRGSRVHEAIAAAGGGVPEADLDRLNLASLLEDGQKIYVPRRGEAVPADPLAGPSGGPSAVGSAPADNAGADGTGGSDSAAGGGPGAAGESARAKVNLNTASVEQLAELPKVGPVLAQRIVDWRTQQGPFKSPEELDAVDGVGPKMLETLLPLVTI